MSSWDEVICICQYNNTYVDMRAPIWDPQPTKKQNFSSKKKQKPSFFDKIICICQYKISYEVMFLTQVHQRMKNPRRKKKQNVLFPHGTISISQCKISYIELRRKDPGNFS